MRGWTWIGGPLLVVLGLLHAGGPPARAQSEPRVEARVSADSVKIGERFTLTLVAARAADRDVMFPDVDAGSAVFGDLHAVRRGAVRTRRPSTARRVDSVAYEVTTFALDSARVPVLPVRLASGGDTTVVGTPPRTVPVPEVRDATSRRLQAVLEQADLVKFADAQPSPAESRSVLDEAQAVLDALEATRRRDDAQATDDTPPSA